MAAETYHCRSDGRDDKRILTVGLVCLDIVNVVDSYPREDTDVRVLDRLWQRGGNAANTSVVLSQLGIRTEYMGTLAQSAFSQLMVEDFDKYGVNMDHCVYHENCDTPVSCVITNTTSGSRTILHQNRSLPELAFKDFESLDLADYAWIHFEGRNIKEVLKMISRVDMYNKQLSVSAATKQIRVSVELEKPRLKPYVKEILLKADVVFVSKDMAKACGHQSGEECVLQFFSEAKQGAQIVCAWGELGAWAIGSSGDILHSVAYPPAKVEDTLGAGDTFNAGVIYSLCSGRSLLDAITQGCRLAGDKIGHQGFRVGINIV